MTSISKAERFFGLSSLHRGAAQFRVISAGQWVACKGPLSASMVLQSDTREAVVFSRVFCAGVSNRRFSYSSFFSHHSYRVGLASASLRCHAKLHPRPQLLHPVPSPFLATSESCCRGGRCTAPLDPSRRGGRKREGGVLSSFAVVGGRRGRRSIPTARSERRHRTTTSGQVAP